jgi:hypothetical protein
MRVAKSIASEVVGQFKPAKSCFLITLLFNNKSSRP